MKNYSDAEFREKLIEFIKWHEEKCKTTRDATEIPDDSSTGQNKI